MEEVTQIRVKDIAPDPQNLRQTFDEDELQALADNLLAVGQTDPIQVFRRPDGTYDLFDGERRWRAAQKAGLLELRAMIIPRPPETELLVKKVSRVMQTKTLSFPEEIRALEDGLKALGVYEDERQWPAASRKLGVPPGVLKERIRRLSPNLQNAFEKGELDYTIAQSLGRIEDTGRQEGLARFIEESKLSNRFVTTRFIPAALEFAHLSPMEAYELARQRERFQYVQPRKEEVAETVVDRLDDILSDIRRVQGWLEVAAKENLLEDLQESEFNTRRFWMAVFRLNQMLSAFIRVNLNRYNNGPLNEELLSEANSQLGLPPGQPPA